MSSKLSFSIHPRVWGPWKERRKKNTSERKKKATVERAIAGRERHLEAHPMDRVAKGHLEKLKQMLRSL